MTAFHDLHEDPPPARSRGRRRQLALAGVGAATLAVGLAVVPGLIGSNSTPAYALTPNADGSITFVINDVRDPEGATRALRQAGVRAVVLPARKPGTCPPDQGGERDDRPFPLLRQVVESQKYREQHPDAGPNVIVIYPQNIPTDSVLVISAIPGMWRDHEQLFIFQDLYREPGPTCYEREVPSWTDESGRPSPSPVTASPSQTG